MTTDGRRQEVLPCLDAHGVEGWSCQTHDGTGLWCANCLANSTSDPEAGLRALEQAFRAKDTEHVQQSQRHAANQDAARFHLHQGIALGYKFCADQLVTYLATRTPQRQEQTDDTRVDGQPDSKVALPQRTTR